MILTPWLWTLVNQNVSVKPCNKISKRITMYVGGFSTIFAWIIKDICKKFICFGVGLVCNKIFLLYRMTFGCNFWFNFGSEESYDWKVLSNFYWGYQKHYRLTCSEDISKTKNKICMQGALFNIKQITLTAQPVKFVLSLCILLRQCVHLSVCVSCLVYPSFQLLEMLAALTVTLIHRCIGALVY